MLVHLALSDLSVEGYAVPGDNPCLSFLDLVPVLCDGYNSSTLATERVPSGFRWMVYTCFSPFYQSLPLPQGILLCHGCLIDESCRTLNEVEVMILHSWSYPL
ncbi:hypothetical protein Adt_35037 [Abeliophyllum distichum]|uniref:Uncharacterized protein n=1 Tax=Abeliophyllum distichum TaxID=126358 RepID=A0ABD1QDU7_9LAMI